MNATERSIDAAVAELCAALPAPALGVERVAARSALHRVLAGDAVSAVDAPAFDNSAMDGYALRFSDAAPGQALREIGRALAGHTFDGVVAPGTCVRVMTGAALPTGADTVAMFEDTRAEGMQVFFTGTLKPGANIRRRGEHLHAGDRLFAAGRMLSAADVGLLVAAGIDLIDVRHPLRVALLSTGDELADPPAPLAAGASYDANRPLLAASLAALGFDVIDLGLCRDDAQAFADAIERAFARDAHVLLTSGGAATGDADVVRKSGVTFLPLNIRPGRGIAYASIERHDRRLILLGLPGNAVAAFISFLLVAQPVLLHLARADATPVTRVHLPLASAVQHRAGRTDWMRARLIRTESHTQVEPLAQQGSAMLRTVTEADALIAIGPRAEYSAGDLVESVLLVAL